MIYTFAIVKMYGCVRARGLRHVRVYSKFSPNHWMGRDETFMKTHASVTDVTRRFADRRLSSFYDGDSRGYIKGKSHCPSDR